MTTASNLRILRISPLMFILMLFCSIIYGKVIYVDDDAAGANDGSSWTDACQCLQNALMFAQHGDEIHVAQGIYKPDREVQSGRDGSVAASGDRRATFQLINGVDMKGGYAGFSGPDPNERDSSLYETILSGDLNGDDNDVNDPCDLLTEPTRAENSYVVVTGLNVDCLLDGLTISGGNANDPIGNPSQNTGGGGMEILMSSITITNCTFRNNSAKSYGGALSSYSESNPTLNNCIFIRNSGGSIVTDGSRGHGLIGSGGMYNRDNSPTLTNCSFIENSSLMGGGMYNDNCNLTLTNCTFSGNMAVKFGGGIFNMDCNAVLADCIFTTNSAQSFGGGIGNAQSNITLTNCTFIENLTNGSGGAIHNSSNFNITLTDCLFKGNFANSSGGAMDSYGNNPTLINCTFSENSTLSSGGGMYNSKASAILTNCTFSRNSAENNGGGIWNTENSDSTLTNCIFSGNKAEKNGGGIYNYYSNPTLISCVFSGNTAADWGGGINNSNSIVGLNNCTFAGNSAEIGNALACDSTNQESPSILEIINCIVWDGDNEIWNNDDSIIFIEYSNVQGGWSGEGGDNIDADPLFVDADGADNLTGTEDDNLRLLPDSPCIDAGENSAIPESVVTDVGGNPRILNDTVDIGAYEFSMEAIQEEIKYGGGTGEPDNPYQIATATDLIALGDSPEDYDKHFIFTADIDLDPNLPGRKVFNKAVIGAGTYVYNNPWTFIGTDPNALIGIDPNILIRIDPNTFIGIGAGAFAGYERFEGTPFTGVLDGNGHTISNLTIIGDSCLGLFGLLKNRAIISNLGLEAVNVNGTGDCIGGLAGKNSGGIIASCYTSGNINGSWYVGGLAGCNSLGTVAYCYSTGTVGGESWIGGLVGFNESEITKCYAANKVSGNKHFGGLAGYSEATFSMNRINNSYFLTSRDGGGPDNGYGFPLTDEQMKKPSSFFDWDFVGKSDGPHDIWAEPVEGGYPILWWQLSPLPELPFSSGNGETNNPYLISTADELNSIGYNPGLMAVHFRLENDIDLAGIDLFMIGSVIFPFSGVFDGNNYTISNFNHTSKYVDYLGLFGYVKGPRAEIRDLGLINPNINWASGDVGSLAGYFGGGTISNCYANGGSVNGYYGVGGLVGSINGSIINCHSSTTVSGIETVGGLVGSVVSLIGSNEYTATVSNCYSSGSVSGERNVGGLVGNNFGYMTNCYTTGDVSGVESVGGLVGMNSFGHITKCYAAAGVAGNVSVGGLAGRNNYTGTISNCYSIGSVSGGGIAGGLVGANTFGHMMNCYARVAVTGDSYVGGLVGYNLEGGIWSCYSTGCVIGTEKVGGLVGENTSIPDQQGQYNTGIIDSSFWDMDTSKQDTSDGGTGKTTAEMQTATAFLEAGWDFVDETENGTEDIWWIDEGNDYPRLWWEGIEQ